MLNILIARLEIDFLKIFLLMFFVIFSILPCKGDIAFKEGEKIKPGQINKNTLLELTLGKSQIFKPSGIIKRISIGDPSIADVVLLNVDEIYLLAKKNGATNLIVWYGDGHTSAIDISVGTDTEGLQSLLSNVFHIEPNIKISSARDSIILNGIVADAVILQQVIKLSEEFSGKKVINLLETDDLPQVLIEVKIAEVDKTLADNIGIQLQGKNFTFNMLNGSPALGFGATASAVSNASTSATTTWLQANIQNGLIKVLAEPNIMAISGQEGQFLSGGIVFIPIPQSSSGNGGSVITLQQQPYGVGVKFTPTVLSGGRINLKIQPEVSDVNNQGISVSSNGSTMVLPSINVRKASTTVQLYDGQSFAIGGLIQNNVTEVISMFPGLVNIPILGALFRSNSFQTNRSELLIVVTPRIVRPLRSKPELPTDKFIEPNQYEFFMDGKLEGSKENVKNQSNERK